MQLFRYPSLVSDNVVKMMDITAKYFFSTLSRRTNNIVKRLSRRIPYHLHINFFDNDYTGHIFACKDAEDAFHFELSPILPAVDELGKQSTVNTNVIERKVKYFIETFHSPTVAIYLIPDFPRKVLENCISFMEKMNIQLKYITFESDRPADDLAMFVIQQARNANHINFLAPTNPDFNIEVSQLQSLKATNLEFPYSSWLTEDHLFNSLMNRHTVSVKYDFEPSVFNTFLKKWIEGSPITKFSCRLERDFEFAACFEEIETTHVVGVFFNYTYYPSVRIIKQAGGQEAAVYKDILPDDNYEFGLTTSFTLLKPSDEQMDFDEEDDSDDDASDIEENDDNQDEDDDSDFNNDSDNSFVDRTERWII